MSLGIIWIVIAILTILLEIMTGTFYLLTVFLGCVVASILGFIGTSLNLQISVAAIVTILGTLSVYYFRRHLRKLNKDTSTDLLDEGNTVTVETVLEDGSAKVNYRGAVWEAIAKEGTLTSGQYKISNIKGNRLVLVK